MPAQQIWISLLLCYPPPRPTEKIYPHLLAPFRLSTTRPKKLTSKYPQRHASYPLCMKPLMLSFAPRISWKRSRPCIIALKFLAQSPFQIFSPISSSSTAQPKDHSYILTYGILSSQEISVHHHSNSPPTKVSVPCYPCCSTQTMDTSKRPIQPSWKKASHCSKIYSTSSTDVSGPSCRSANPPTTTPPSNSKAYPY